MARWWLAIWCCGSPSSVVLGDDFLDQSLPIFDGQSLLGWEGDARWFRVEQGALVAGSLDRPIPHNQFLCTTQNYDDFELRLEARLVGPGRNAGVQFRSTRLPGSSEVSGYQADIGSMGSRIIWGGLYDESRRRRFLATPDPELAQRIVQLDDWNQIRVICRGPRIQIWINGEPMVDYTETDAEIRNYGVIGLQIHSGPPSEAWYRDIRVRQL